MFRKPGIWLSFITVCLLTPTAIHAQLLQITSPKSGTVVAAGTTITISVEADRSVQSFLVLADHHLPDPHPTSRPDQFTLAIPKTVAVGVYDITAFGVTSSADVGSEPIEIHVEREDTPIAVESEEHFLVFRVGSQRSLTVLATFQDKSVVDVTKSSKLRFSSSNAKCATVDQSGSITAKSVGECVIQVIYTNDQARVIGAAYLEVVDR